MTDRRMIRTAVVQRQGARIRCLYQENRGPAVARNAGAQLALTPWISFQDADDVCAPNHLQTLYGYVKDHADVGMVFANGIYLIRPEHNRKSYYSCGQIQTSRQTRRTPE